MIVLEPIPPEKIALHKKYGKPFDYFRLGKSAFEGRAFLDHMKQSALQLWFEAEKAGAIDVISKCPICDRLNPQVLFEFLKFPYAQCRDAECNHVFIQKPVKDGFRWKFFSRDDVYSKNNYCDPERTKFRVEQIAIPKVDHVFERLADASRGSWLDVGCGSGEILFALKQKSWRAMGLELSLEGCRFGREELDVDIRNQTIEDFVKTNQGELFDVVSFFGVLHCVRKPAELIAIASKILKPGGLLVAEVTHFHSMMTESVKSFPDHPTRSSYNGATTLHMFTQQSVQRIFQDAGLQALSVWFLGADIFEILNQWCLSDPNFSGSPLYQKLLTLTNDIQKNIDQAELSESMIWIARKNA